MESDLSSNIKVIIVIIIIIIIIIFSYPLQLSQCFRALTTSHVTKRYDTMFLIRIYLDFKFCPFFLGSLTTIKTENSVLLVNKSFYHLNKTSYNFILRNKW
jgi:hypothetical protein